MRQARALLWAADGVANAEIARRCGLSAKSVRRWRSWFGDEGLASVGRVRRGRGRRREADDEVVAAIVGDTLHAVPDDGSEAWSIRALAARHGVGTVARIWRSRGLRPWKAGLFKLSADPDFEATLVDVVGLYLTPPGAAAVFCFD
jgi:Winged helix-turn helix